jgi:hypothetical protein
MNAVVGIDAQGDLLIDLRSDGRSNDVVVVSDSLVASTCNS